MNHREWAEADIAANIAKAEAAVINKAKRTIRAAIANADGGVDALTREARIVGRKLIDDAEQARTNAQLSERSE